jgi:hypothetical protein
VIEKGSAYVGERIQPSGLGLVEVIASLDQIDGMR